LHYGDKGRPWKAPWDQIDDYERILKWVRKKKRGLSIYKQDKDTRKSLSGPREEWGPDLSAHTRRRRGESLRGKGKEHGFGRVRSLRGDPGMAEHPWGYARIDDRSRSLR